MTDFEGTAETKEAQPNATMLNIFSLSDDTLLQIFDYLSPNICDQVFFGCVSARLCGLFNLWAKRKPLLLNSTDVEDMALPDIIDFFQLAGPHIKLLAIDCESFQKESLIVEFVAEYCKNIEEIEFLNVSDGFHYGKLLRRLNTLTKVSIDCIDSDDVFTFDLTSNLNLQSFTLISGCYTGHNLCGLPNLKHLVLRDCLLWNSAEFVTPLVNLKTLELDDCSFEVSNIPLYQQIADHCVQLEELTFSCCDTNYDMIAELPNLKRLTVTTWMHSNELQSSFLFALAAKKSNELVYLKIMGQIFITSDHARAIGNIKALRELHWHNNDNFSDTDLTHFDELQNLEVFGINWCSYITDEGATRMLRQCKKLRLFDVRNCMNITNDFVLAAIRYLSKPVQIDEPRSLVVIDVQNSGITSKVLQNSLYKKAGQLLRVNFLQTDY